MPRASSFTFGSYSVDTERSTLSFTYEAELPSGKIERFTDRLYLESVTSQMWEEVPKHVLEPTLQALLLMLGMNYWMVYPTRNMRIKEFSLTRDQAAFWNELYLHGLSEYFFLMKMDFEGLIDFPFDETRENPTASAIELPKRALLLNGAGKDSILSAEMLKEQGVPFDLFSYGPSPAHERIGALIGARTITVHRKRDPRINLIAALHMVSGAYPSVSTFTFVAVLLAELIGYDSIVFSNEKSADFGNLVYKGLPVNHQWCKSTEAEKLINDYIHTFITPNIHTYSLLREFSEIEIVKRFVQYPKYLPHVTSCNSYFWLPRWRQKLMRKAYWCKDCPKCVFLFACFSAFLPKKDVVAMVGGNLYEKWHLQRLFRRILGIESFKPLDCVGEPEEMILAMHYASRSGEYAGTPAMRMFEKHFPATYDFASIEEHLRVRRPE